jgi:RND family efflux transporter MFP subunit
LSSRLLDTWDYWMREIFNRHGEGRTALVGGVLALFAVCCAAQPAAPAASSGAESPKASTAQAGEVAAIVQATEETTLSAQMAGRILKIHIGLGEQARAGARLLEFDCSEGQAQLLAAEAEFRGARETHLARLRLQALGAAGELEVTLAAAAAEKARSQVDLRKAQLAYCHVNAPFPGRIARLRVKASESVQIGQAMIDMVNPAALKIQMFVPAAWSVWLRPNLPFELKIKETGRSYPARVSKLNSRVEGVSQQLEVEARLDGNSAGLLPGIVGVAVFSPQVAR